MIRTQISFDEQLYRAAQIEAKRLGISLAELCRRAVGNVVRTQAVPDEPWMRFSGVLDGGAHESDNESIDAVVSGPKE